MLFPPLSVPPLSLSFPLLPHPYHLHLCSSLSFILPKAGTWNLILGLEHTYMRILLDVLSEDLKGNGLWFLLLFGKTDVPNQIQ